MKKTNTSVIVRIATVPSVFGLQLAGQPALLRNAGIPAIWVSSPPEKWTEWPDDIPVSDRYEVILKRQIAPYADLLALWQLIRFFKKQKPAIVHTHSPKAGLLGMLAAWFCRVPVRIHTLAGTPLSTATGTKKKFLFGAEWATAKCSTETRVSAPSLLRWGIAQGFLAPEKSIVLLQGSSNGIDLEQFNPNRFSKEDKQSLLLHHKIPEGATIWLFVGRLVAEKGMVEILTAFQMLQTRYDNQVLVCIGPLEKERDPIEDEYEIYLKTKPSIFHIPWSNEIPLWMAAATALVHPSYREGFPNVLLEAGAMNCPVLVSSIDGNTDLISEETFGYLFPVKSSDALLTCMERFLQDAVEVKQAKSKELYQYIHQHFDRKVIHQELLRHYHKRLLQLGQAYNQHSNS
jgi:glycosyltransferase involved in cell wall biosynthesis